MTSAERQRRRRAQLQPAPPRRAVVTELARRRAAELVAHLFIRCCLSERELERTAERPDLTKPEEALAFYERVMAPRAEADWLYEQAYSLARSLGVTDEEMWKASNRFGRKAKLSAGERRQ